MEPSSPELIAKMRNLLASFLEEIIRLKNVGHLAELVFPQKWNWTDWCWRGEESHDIA